MTAQFLRFLQDRLGALPFAVSTGELLVRDAPGGLREPGQCSANGHCRLIAVRDGWVAVNLARPDDVELVAALSQREGPPWSALAAAAHEQGAVEFVARAIELQMPVARVGEAQPVALAAACRSPPRAFRVLDLSALWAGPLCAGLLARAGADVVRVENVVRPDPTPEISPQLDAWLNGAKRRVTLDLASAEGREHLLEEIARCDVLVTSARPAALVRLGLGPELLTNHPGLVWAAVTAHGWKADRVGFGDDCASAGGLVRWEADEPNFIGDALADPLTGLEGALAVLARLANGQGGRIDLAMAQIAATYARASAA